MFFTNFPWWTLGDFVFFLYYFVFFFMTKFKAEIHENICMEFYFQKTLLIASKSKAKIKAYFSCWTIKMSLNVFYTTSNTIMYVNFWTCLCRLMVQIHENMYVVWGWWELIENSECFFFTFIIFSTVHSILLLLCFFCYFWW